MKDTLLYYYNIRAGEIIEDNSSFHFRYYGDYYCFVPLSRNAINFANVLNIYKLINKKTAVSHIIIKNKFNNYISYIGKSEYVLLKIKKMPSLIVDFPTIVNNSKRYVGLNSKNNQKVEWDILWQKKIDYLENQIRKLGNGKDELINSFSYYVGLAENAIIYYKNININKNDVSITVQHRRIFIPNIWLNYGNPLALEFDFPERDIAEYLKYTFFYANEEDAYNDFEYLIKTNYMDYISWKILLSRLLFPTYYFDVFERTIVNNSHSDELLKIVQKVNKYEVFLKQCYNMVNEHININEFPGWLL